MVNVMVVMPNNKVKENLNINIIGNKEIEGKSISVLNITVNINNKIIPLGEFYVDYIEEISEDYYEYMYSLLIEDIDNIIFENNRYIGSSQEIKDFLQGDDENITEIYLEFIEMEKNTKEYKKYSRFFELYFHSHKIPDSIKKIFLDKNNKSILDYENLDHEIKKEFSNSMNELIEQMEQEEMLVKLEDIKSKEECLKNELELIKEIIDRIQSLISQKEKNHKIKLSMQELEMKLAKMHIFDKRKKEIKNSLNVLDSSIVKIDIAKEKGKIRELISNYSSLYAEPKGLELLFDSMSLGDILYIIKDLYEKKLNIYDRILEEENELIEKTTGYVDNTIDISDLYDRLETSKTKE